MLADKLKIALQHCIPQHGLSRLVGFFAASRNPLIRKLFIKSFARSFGISLEEAEREQFSDYQSFNDFFTRKLKTDVRPIDGSASAFVSPVDGAVSQHGDVVDDTIVQAKGHDYSVTALLGGDPEQAKVYEGGKFTTIYLSPSDYHRIHMPVTGKLKRMTYIPGKLFSVNPLTAENVANLFARNERVVCTFDTEFGELTMVLVGATIVASIETIWAGVITPPRGSRSFTWHYSGEQAITLEKGEEMGLFKLGSTVICLMPEGAMAFEPSYQNDVVVRLGRKIAELKSL